MRLKVFSRPSSGSPISNPTLSTQNNVDRAPDQFVLPATPDQAASRGHTAHPSRMIAVMRTVLRAAGRRLSNNAGPKHFSSAFPGPQKVAKDAMKCISYAQHFWFLSEAGANPDLKRRAAQPRNTQTHGAVEEPAANSGMEAPEINALVSPEGEIGRNEQSEEPGEHNSTQSAASDSQPALLPVPDKVPAEEAPGDNTPPNMQFGHPVERVSSDSAQSASTVTESNPTPGISYRDFAYENNTPEGSARQLYAPLHGSPSLSSLTNQVPQNADSSPRSSIRSRVSYELPRCDSPYPLGSPRKAHQPMPRPSSLRISTEADARCELINGVCRLRDEHICQMLDIPPSLPEEASAVTPTDLHPPSRKILIIGSTYEGKFRRTDKRFSIETLVGVVNDMNQLEEAFKERNYLVEKIGTDNFDGKHVLTRVAAFLKEAKQGDVRAVAFSGHAYTSDKTVMLVPPECPKVEMAISQADWEQNIRDNSKPGVIVLSIMAHCFSGDFMKQEQDCQTWRSTKHTSDLSMSTRTDKPIFITFVSSASNQFTFESTVRSDGDQARVMDHFIYALVMALRSKDVRTWKAFFATFKVYFDKARSSASWAAADESDLQEAAASCVREKDACGPRASVWRADNHQEPSFSASENVGYLCVF